MEFLLPVVDFADLGRPTKFEETRLARALIMRFCIEIRFNDILYVIVYLIIKLVMFLIAA